MTIVLLALLSAVAVAAAHAHSASSKIEVDGDGGYSGIVIKIADDGSVPEDKCQEILDNIRVSHRIVIKGLSKYCTSII